jgi:nucleotide-binding universal stress UspA family protein
MDEEGRRLTNLFKKILVPYDLTKSSDSALGYAIDIANLCNSDVIILHILPTTPLLHSPVRHGKITFTSNPYQEIYDQMEANAQIIINSRREALEREAMIRNGRTKKDLSVSTHVAVGDNAAAKIVNYAKRHKVDLIVMSSTNTAPKNPVKRIFWLPLRSISRAVSEMAPCPILLIRPI